MAQRGGGTHPYASRLSTTAALIDFVLAIDAGGRLLRLPLGRFLLLDASIHYSSLLFFEPFFLVRLLRWSGQRISFAVTQEFSEIKLL